MMWFVLSEGALLTVFMIGAFRLGSDADDAMEQGEFPRVPEDGSRGRLK